MMLKMGVGAVDLHPALRYGLLVVEEECWKVTGKGCTITALGDGAHSGDSLHYGVAYQGRKAVEADDRCRAADFRVRDYTPEVRDKVYTRVRRRLGPDFDFIDEGDHWHLEYDPKAP